MLVCRSILAHILLGNDTKIKNHVLWNKRYKKRLRNSINAFFNYSSQILLIIPASTGLQMAICRSDNEYSYNKKTIFRTCVSTPASLIPNRRA